MHALCTYVRTHSSFGTISLSLSLSRRKEGGTEGMESCTCRPFAENPAGEEGLVVGERTKAGCQKCKWTRDCVTG